MSGGNWWERDKSKDKPAPKKKTKPKTRRVTMSSGLEVVDHTGILDMSGLAEPSHDEDQRTIEEIAARATNFKEAPAETPAKKLVMEPGVEVVGTKKMSKVNLALVSRDDVGVVSDVFGKFSMAVRYPDPVGRLFGFREEWRIKP